MTLLPEELREPVAARLQKLEQDGFARRLWEHDASLWKSDPAHKKIISAALGWLGVPTDVRDELDDLRQFCAEVRAEGYTDAVLLGMGGSSLAPEVLRATFGVARGYLDLHVLDSTDPAAVLGLSEALDLAHSLFIVASKSGGTTETASFAAFFYERLQELCGEEAGRHFVAITDEGTSLQRQAVEQDFRAVFVNPSDIGGRYSALSFFGLVPAVLMGLELDHLLDHAADMVESCGPDGPAAENPGLVLGAALGELALRGRDKLTLLVSPALASFGAWVEQLVAESTGKEGTGVLPVDGEPAGAAAAYGDDRAFVYVRLACQPDLAQDQLARDLAAAGQPVITLELEEIGELGGEFFRWEVATAVLGALLGIDPFDQPNVQESKDNTRRLLDEYEKSGGLPEEATGPGDAPVSLPVGDGAVPAALRALLGRTQAGDYVALQAYVCPHEAVWAQLQRARSLVRDRLHLATTLGYGPRYLHSTGQYHKGGPNNGVFLQLVGHDPVDVAIPGQKYTFGVLKRAQARGDLAALRGHDCRVLRLCLGDDVPAGVERLRQALEAVL
jgi:glucose-6-phosphate isomerase